MPERAAAVEFRVSGRTLVGEAIRYNQQARDRAELFESGAFQPIGDVTLNLQHDPERVIADTRAGTLRIDDSPDALRLEADLRENSAELALVRRRALRGLSVEFRCRSERRDDGLRVVEKADLPAIGLVDSGSYRTGVELRAVSSSVRLVDCRRFGLVPGCNANVSARLTCTGCRVRARSVHRPVWSADECPSCRRSAGHLPRVCSAALTRRGTLLVEQTRARVSGYRVDRTERDGQRPGEVIDSRRGCCTHLRAAVAGYRR